MFCLRAPNCQSVPVLTIKISPFHACISPVRVYLGWGPSASLSQLGSDLLLLMRNAGRSAVSGFAVFLGDFSFSGAPEHKKDSVIFMVKRFHSNISPPPLLGEENRYSRKPCVWGKDSPWSPPSRAGPRSSPSSPPNSYW